MLARALALCVCLLPAAAAAPPRTKAKPNPQAKFAAGPPPIAITVFHTNDIHGWLLPRIDETLQPGAHRPIGGAEALASYLKRQSGPRLLLDAGDWYQGTPEGDLSKGRSLIDVFNALRYDAVEIGNHEFDFGAENLQALVQGSSVPVLGANIYLKGQRRRPGWVTPWIIKEVAGVKVGVFGLLTTAMPKLAFPSAIQGLEFRREVDEAKDAVALLRGAGATVIIALTHVGYENPRSPVKFEGDQTIAREVPGIDLIVGGHTHTFLRHPEHEPAHGTLIVQAGTGLTAVGRVALEIDPQTKRVVSSSGALDDLWADSLGGDPDLHAVIAPYAKEADKAFGVVIATSEVALARNVDGESGVNDWVTDCEREWGRADLAVQNGSGTRADIRPGPVTLRTIFELMPFDNRLVTVRMKGRDVADLLNAGVRSMAMLQVSGAELHYDRRPAGSPSTASDIRIGGAPLDPDRDYKVVASDFMTDGAGYAAFARAERKETSSALLRDVLADCARRQRVIKAPASPRMIPMEAASGSQERAR